MSVSRNDLPLPATLLWLRKRELPRKLGFLERLYGRRLATSGIRWAQAANGVTWKLDLANVTHRWIVYGKYEGGGLIDWARDHLAEDAIVVDSGANIGQMLLYLGKFVPRGLILAFEPYPAARAWLEECLACNPQLRVRCLPIALGSRSEQLFLEELGTVELHGSWNQVSPTSGIPIQVARLEDVLSEQGIATVDLWKLDVEGYELEALAGAERMLRSHAIRAIYAELGFGHGHAIVAFLRERGYRCRLFDRRGRLYEPTKLPAHTNSLFLPEEIPA